MKLNTLAAFILICMSGLALAQQAPDGLQFNVPYLCNDGNVYVVHRCEKWPKFEACFYQHEPDSERYNTRQAVVYQMTKMCKVQGAASPAAASPSQVSAGASPTPRTPAALNDSRWDCGGGATMTIIQCQKNAGQDSCFIRLEQDGKFIAEVPKPLNEIQSHVSACKAMPTLNPVYLAEFPSTYRVVQGMLVGKPQDNMVRSIGAFYQLSEIIRAMAGSRALTPDEQKFLGDYSRLQAEMADAAAKKFPGQQFDPASNPYRFKRTDPRFGFEGIPVWTTYLTPGMQDAFARAVGGDDDKYAIAVDRQKRAAAQKVDDDIRAADAEAHYKKDPGSVAARHCVESGRSEVECLSEGLKVGAQDLFGGNPLKGIVPDTPVGLRLTGVYSAGNFGMRFQQDNVIVGCGTLIEQPYPYTIQRSATQISVTVPISPKPLLLSYRDGKLFGPGPIDVAGRVVIGGAVDHASTSYVMQTQTTTSQRQIAAADVGNYAMGEVHQNGMDYSVDQQTSSTNWTPTTQHHYEVPTAPKTERCNVGALPATGANASVSGALTQILGSKESKSANTAPGLRLNGTYAVVGGLKIEFRDDSATLQCGESFSAEAYAMHWQGAQLVVNFENSTGPLSLILQPNGTLTGSGDIEVAGRRAVQGAGGGIDYLPRNAHCSLGTLQASR
jgi:hypothetical protein